MMAQPTESVPTTATDAPILQDWSPLTHCLDWHLGQLAFQHRGAQAFTTNEVPNLINQGGMSAYRAAEVLFANCAEAHEAGRLEDNIIGMELAMGLGLHSVQLLDRFKQRCGDAGNDWYDRLTWYATDVTPKMLQDAQGNGVFERHADRVVLARADALNPAHVVLLDGGETRDLSGKLRAVFHSYLLCVLPANVFQRAQRGDENATWAVLMARTVLRHPEGLSRFTNLTVDGVQSLAASRAAPDLMRLVPLYPLMDLDLTLAPMAEAVHDDLTELQRVADLIEHGLTQPTETEDDPSESASEAAKSALKSESPAVDADETTADDNQNTATWVLHSAGAMASVGATLHALRTDGFLLYRDYGPASAKSANSSHLYQHYGATTAIGVNHFALDSWAATMTSPHDDEATLVITAPPGEGEAAIKTRLLSFAPLEATRATFSNQFDPADFQRLQTAVETARKAAATPNAAMDGYRHALSLERDNWVLLTEAADYALRRARNLELAQMLVGEALRINPWYGEKAWNCLGDIYWFSDQLDAAEQAFVRATEANPEAHIGWFNRYLVARQRGDFEQAVEMAARALAMDRTGTATAQLQPALQEATRLLQEQRGFSRQWRKQRNAGSPI